MKNMEEDKQLICSQLCLALQMTNNCKDLLGIVYDKEKELVHIRFAGGTKPVNVQMDSGTAMARDIVNHLGT